MNILELISTTTKRDCECQNTLLSLEKYDIQSFANIVDRYIYLLNFADNSIILKSATKPLNVLIAFTRPLITEFADNLNLKHPLLPTISPYTTM